MVPAAYGLPAAVLFVAGGGLACFMGYRIFRIVLGIYGFILGALLATSVMAPTETPTTLLVALGGGLVGALILIAAYFVGVAFLGAALAALLVHVLWSQLGGDPHPLVIIIACVLGALAAMALQKLVIVFGTAFGGAWTMLAGALALMGNQAALTAATRGESWLTYPFNPLPGQRWTLLAWLALGVVGAAVQMATSPRARRR
jgi:hypothetical protein